MAEQHWRVQDSSYRMPRDHKPVVLYYDPTPGGRKNDDGTTTISLNFPALVITEWVNQPEEIGRQVAAELNAFPALVGALKKIEHASRKDSLTDSERLQSVRTVVCAALSRIGVGGAPK